jgi:hypothetical protein
LTLGRLVELLGIAQPKFSNHLAWYRTDAGVKGEPDERWLRDALNTAA